MQRIEEQDARVDKAWLEREWIKNIESIKWTVHKNMALGLKFSYWDDWTRAFNWLS